MKRHGVSKPFDSSGHRHLPRRVLQGSELTNQLGDEIRIVIEPFNTYAVFSAPDDDCL
jgi:hypothetical protein